MNDTFVRPQPTKLRIICKQPKCSAEIGHQLFNIFTHQPGTKKVDRATHQFIAAPHGEYNSGPRYTGAECQSRNREGIYRIGVHRIGASARLELESAVLSGNSF